MYTAKITSKGQITLPVDVRRKLNLKEGDRVAILESDEGFVFLNSEDLVTRNQLAWKTVREDFKGAAEKVGWKDVDDVVKYIKELREENERDD